MLCVIVLSAYNATAKECVDCHTGVLKHLQGNSHHIQGTGVTGRHCYACHWESTPDGQINKRYHDAKSAGKPGSTVHLVVWADGVRPTEYKKNVTAIPFRSAAIGTPSERAEVAKVSAHCLSCHNDGTNDVKPFAGDGNTPRQYAWDLQSVASRYSQSGVTPWGKYSTAATNKKSRITKAFSAHGNSAANQGGWSAVSGYDGDVTSSRGGAKAKNVECFDCHNSHGSTVSGVTSSYQTYGGSFSGGILKDTVSGKGGYHTSYKPSANSDAKSKNPYNAGAGLCFDCHETAKAGKTPWGFSSTFGARQPIIGYKDTLRFASGEKGSTSRFANRQSRSDVASSHLKSGSFLNYSAHGKINGLCTPCHDPHGVSRTLGDRMPYAVPLLKGTWLTSPYKEDGPPAGVKAKASTPIRKTDYNATNRDGNANFGKGDSSAPRSGDYNATNRSANSNFGKGVSSAPRSADYNTTNRDGNANFGKGDSSAPRSGDYNATNRSANSNFGKGESSAPRSADYNTTNRDGNANFGKGDSSAPRSADYNTTNRDGNANFGKGDSSAPRSGDYNATNRSANSNFGKGESSAPRSADYNTTNRDGNANFGKGGSPSPRTSDFNVTNREDNSNFGKMSGGAPREPIQGMKYSVDRNTFGGDHRIRENDDTFGGLCMQCHKKENFAGNSKTALIHRSVKGWGENKEHSFPCSKCHQSHNSGLPRLMQTNCFQEGPSGLRENSGLAWLPYKNSDDRSGVPAAVKSSDSSKNKVVGCHVRQFGKSAASADKKQNGQWKELTPW